MIPMDATEAWLLPMLRDAAWEECASDPASQFKGGKPKLLEQSGKKKRRAYEDATGTMAACWSRAQRLSQFARFATDLAGAVGALEGS